MRSSKSLASVLALAACQLAGCGVMAQQQPGTLSIRSARLSEIADAPVLELALDCRLSGPMQDALDHGIPLTILITVDSGRWYLPGSALHSDRRIELRYFPLSRRYQLRDLDTASADVRSFATPGYLSAGLNSLRLPLPSTFAALSSGARVRIDAGLETARLPGALRLPALFEPAWRLSAAEFTWQAPAG
ncbi:MAG: DUF4390 domain-containing protein [Rhodanobacteraceae bacterium]